jgi:methionyl-tRNA formyltransferase
MIREARTPILADDTTATLHDRLAHMGAELIVAGLRDLERDGALRSTPQPNEGTTYAEKIAKNEAALDWRRTAQELARQIRAFDPFPGAYSTIDNAAIKIWAAQPVDVSSDAQPGTIAEVSPDGIVVICGSGALKLTQLQKPGGKRLSVREFLAGAPLAKGQRFTVQ